MPRTAAPRETPPVRVNIAEDVFCRLRDMAIQYELKPGERLNEVDLAERLGVSRTPVREALYRLAQEGFLVESGRGYSRRQLDVKETLDLYEARCAIEAECARLAAERASDEALDEIDAFLKSSAGVPADTSASHLVELDEAFHERIARASGNAELMRILINLNHRIRFIRWINMEKIGRDHTQAEHRKILAALRKRDADACVALLRTHITHRTDQIVDAITAGLARIYLQQP
ncbi:MULTISPECIES: GntR family transcriptional regulator [Burkholderiaceae]|uniref:GntR family transcriptional regulator n=1 Tax=Burkholderiaceae TaxID=119060 RepID=UPI00141F6122|nr:MULTISPECIES: GntR family transcriptional regulator [Burkholderiaceae]MBN3846609.1 GntR family transcriptional regulator [Paraburkholderia sp. Ac-20342]NIF55694.1 GntR family transcriptional regulator [Burkholderia sp. Ax-1724]NIF78017.1 GntR family transcriptional regulator [Paraburkholderia sp. Cy-641]